MFNLMLAVVNVIIRPTMPMLFSHNQVGDMILDMDIGMILEVISTILMPTSLRRWVGVRLPTHDPLIGGR